MSDIVSPADLMAFHTFAAYRDDELEVLASILVARDYPAGAKVCEQGEEGVSCFVLLSGALEVERSIPDLGTRRLGSLLPGAIFGQLSLIDGLPRLATCRAVGPCRVAELERGPFLQLCQEGSRFATTFQLEVARALTRQLRQSNQTLSEIEEAGPEKPDSAALTSWLDALMTDSRRAV